MEIISQADYLKLLDGKIKILEQDNFGIKIFEVANDKVIKLFRLKSYCSSAIFKPYALRFKNNAERLRALGISSVAVERLAYCPDEKRYIVIYPKLPGISLRQRMNKFYDQSLIHRLAEFIANLHDKGVYFRSLHMGNILLLESGEFGLIDIADMRIFGKPLSLRLRVRNFRHLLRYEKDLVFIDQFGIRSFVSSYQLAGEMSSSSEERFEREWRRLKLPLLTNRSSRNKYSKSDP